MYQLYTQQQELALGWEFYVPLIGMVILILLAVRIWTVIGLGSLVMLYTTGVLAADPAR